MICDLSHDDVVRHLLQAFNATVNRTEPHWTRMGSENSWEGWIWSYGNGRRSCMTGS